MTTGNRETGASRGVRGLLLDRDGTLCEEVGYLDSPERVRLIGGAAAALRLARSAGFRIAVVTNQSGVARGLFDMDAVDRVHDRLRRLLELEAAHIDAVFVCPHHPEHDDGLERGACDCRKPEPGLILRAGRELGLDLSRSYTIGDRYRDLQAGFRAGTRTILVRTGYGAREFEYHPEGEGLRPDHVADDLLAAIRWIVGTEPRDVHSVGTGTG